MNYDEFIKYAQAQLQEGQKGLLPQRGFQYEFLNSAADIVIGGGSAGGGKTYALLIEPTRWRHLPTFGAVTFRRLRPEIVNIGGLWDEAKQLYGASTRGFPVSSPSHTWYFPHPQDMKRRGARVVFTHLQHDDTVMQHHGAQYPLIQWDELATFSSYQFWYLLSRNRTDLPIRPYMRAVTNPDPVGWLKDLIAWFLYPDDHPNINLAGYPIPERIGKLRYFIRDGGQIMWGNSKAEIIRKYPDLFPPDDQVRPEDKIKSLTFIPGNVRENLELMKRDPGYIGTLMALEEAERNRLLLGCWRHIPGDDDLFDDAALEDTFSNTFIRPEEKRYLTADVAHEGADKFVICIWYGWVLQEVRIYEKVNGKAVIQILRQALDDHNIPARNMVYDRDGIGDYLSGFFKTSYGFRGNAAPLPSPHVKPSGRRSGARQTDRPKFKNLRTQMYYELSYRIAEAGIYIPIEGKLRREIRKELMATKKLPKDTGGNLRIMAKEDIAKRIGHSPDLADAIMMRMVFEFIRRVSRSRTTSG